MRGPDLVWNEQRSQTAPDDAVDMLLQQVAPLIARVRRVHRQYGGHRDSGRSSEGHGGRGPLKVDARWWARTGHLQYDAPWGSGERQSKHCLLLADLQSFHSGDGVLRAEHGLDLRASEVLEVEVDHRYLS